MARGATARGVPRRKARGSHNGSFGRVLLRASELRGLGLIARGGKGLHEIEEELQAWVLPPARYHVREAKPDREEYYRCHSDRSIRYEVHGCAPEPVCLPPIKDN